MRYLKFEAVEDQEFGGLGLVNVTDRHKLCNGMFTAQTGLILAHDIIEHQQGFSKIGSIGDEMLALGGVVFTRADWSDLSRNGSGSRHTPAEHLASDVVNMGRMFLQSGVPFRQKLQTTRLDSFEILINDTIECAREAIRDELDDDESVSQHDIDTYLEGCRILMLRGTYLANKRFNSQAHANTLFWDIENAANCCIEHLEYVGQRFRLGYEWGNVVMEECYPEDY